LSHFHTHRRDETCPKIANAATVYGSDEGGGREVRAEFGFFWREGDPKTPPPAPPRSGEGRKAISSPLPASGRGWGRGFGRASIVSKRPGQLVHFFRVQDLVVSLEQLGDCGLMNLHLGVADAQCTVRGNAVPSGLLVADFD